MRRPKLAIVHDYLTQRGGGERVLLEMARAFPDAPIYTALYQPETTFPEFSSLDIRPSKLNGVGLFRRDHRLALPVLAALYSSFEVQADVVLCNSSGWSHGVRTEGRKLVYCLTPARWLYQTSEYTRGSALPVKMAATRLRSALIRWDRRAAATASRFLTTATVVRERIRTEYGVDADIVPPPPAIRAEGSRHAVPGLEPGYYLCVSRLLPYKNVDAVVDAFSRDFGGRRLVVCGGGPCAGELRARAGESVTFLEGLSDEQLRWLYAEAAGLIAASYEDYGLTPLEAACFGVPVAVLRWGGFLDTVVEGRTGVFFDTPAPSAIQDAVERLEQQTWDRLAILDHAAGYSRDAFAAGLHRAVAAMTNA